MLTKFNSNLILLITHNNQTKIYLLTWFPNIHLNSHEDDYDAATTLRAHLWTVWLMVTKQKIRASLVPWKSKRIGWNMCCLFSIRSQQKLGSWFQKNRTDPCKWEINNRCWKLIHVPISQKAGMLYCAWKHPNDELSNIRRRSCIKMLDCLVRKACF